MTPFEEELHKSIYIAQSFIDDDEVKAEARKTAIEAIKQAVSTHILSDLAKSSYYVPEIETDVVDLRKITAARQALGEKE